MLPEKVCSNCLSYMLDCMPGWLRCLSCGFMKKGKNSMISMQELLCGNKLEDLTPELLANAQELLKRINKFREVYGIPMVVNSGYRTAAHNIEIGGAKNSAHCLCMAIDIRDEDGAIKKYIAEHPEILEQCDLYQEDPLVTPSWVHLQTRQASHRVFKK